MPLFHFYFLSALNMLCFVPGKATCLVGPVGCGKTALVEHLASITGRAKDWLRKVQLGDQTDSRTLLGTYRCTDVPGEFVWQPGVLTQVNICYNYLSTLCVPVVL